MTGIDAALQRGAERVRCELAAQDDAWETSGWTRRKFLAGAGMVGVAALGSQLVTTRAAYAATPSATDQTLVVIFMRGAADGLHALVPNSSALGLDYLQQVRPNLIPATSNLIGLPSTGGWAINSALKPLYDRLWGSGQLAFVPAVSDPGISRSHFQAAQYLECGGSMTATNGWLDRTLDQLGAGTTFRAVAVGATTPVSMNGPSPTLALASIDQFAFPGWAQIQAASETAVLQLYRGLDGPLGEDVPDTIAALSTAATVKAVKPATVKYPSGDFAASLQTLASILRADVGLQVATVDVGGWDTHTSEAGDLDTNLGAAATALGAFFDDLGPTRRQRVTVVMMTEFGRRVEMNASGGTDHGHGSVMWLMGGGLAGSGVYGKWNQLSDSTTDQGDVPGLNNPFDVLGELVQNRLGVGSLSTIFPGHSLSPIGVT